MSTQHDERLVAPAASAMRKSHRRAVTTAGATLQDRQQRVAEGRRVTDLAHMARGEYLSIDARLRPRIRRPRWLSARINLWAKILLILSDIGAGTALLVIGGDPLWLAALTFAGVAVASVLAGTQVGIHARRREEGDTSGILHWIAAATILVGSIAFGAYRYLTLGAAFAILAIVPLMVALGSAFLGYLWQDKNADEIDRAKDTYLQLERDAEDQFGHKAVRRFEQAESELRPAALQALNDAHQESMVKRSVWDQAQSDPLLSSPIAAPGRNEVELLLVTLLGPEILHLVPKADLETAEPRPRVELPAVGPGPHATPDREDR